MVPLDFLCRIAEIAYRDKALPMEVSLKANSWINSSIAAGTVNCVYARDILYANGATPHGIATQSLGSLYYYDDTLWYWWPNSDPLEADGPLPRQDFTVNLV